MRQEKVLRKEFSAGQQGLALCSLAIVDRVRVRALYLLVPGQQAWKPLRAYVGRSTYQGQVWQWWVEWVPADKLMAHCYK
jgi:hypothetical protein